MAAKKTRTKRKQKKPSYDDLVRYYGAKAMADLLRDNDDERVEVLPPGMEELERWLEIEIIKGKFPAFWHHRIAEAKDCRLPIPLLMYQLAGLFDEVFPATSNTFNIVSRRPHVTEPMLLDFLRKDHGIEAAKAGNMKLTELAMILEDTLALRACESVAPAAVPPANVVKKRRRGRPPKSDIKKDRRIREAWETRRYRDYAELASRFQMPVKEIRRALDRERKRKP